MAKGSILFVPLLRLCKFYINTHVLLGFQNKTNLAGLPHGQHGVVCSLQDPCRSHCAGLTCPQTSLPHPGTLPSPHAGPSPPAPAHRALENVKDPVGRKEQCKITQKQCSKIIDTGFQCGKCVHRLYFYCKVFWQRYHPKTIIGMCPAYSLLICNYCNSTAGTKDYHELLYNLCFGSSLWFR